MKINEIFLSIQGEGTDQGEPCIFVRTFGCNNSCNYCDTTYATQGDNYREMNTQDVIEKVKGLGYKNICLTGGEPLLWKETHEFCKILTESGYIIWIETNGTMPINNFVYTNNIHIVMDIKCPSSGMEKNTRWENMALLRSCDQVKFVVATDEDYEFAKKNILQLANKCKAKFLISPIFEQGDFKPELTSVEIIQKVLDDKLPVRISLQIHKFIWGPTKKEGVRKIA